MTYDLAVRLIIALGVLCMIAIAFGLVWFLIFGMDGLERLERRLKRLKEVRKNV